MAVCGDMAEVKVLHNRVERGAALRREEEELVAEFGREVAEGVLAYHRTMPGYQPTPTHELTQVRGSSSLGNCLKEGLQN